MRPLKCQSRLRSVGELRGGAGFPTPHPGALPIEGRGSRGLLARESQASCRSLFRSNEGCCAVIRGKDHRTITERRVRPLSRQRGEGWGEGWELQKRIIRTQTVVLREGRLLPLKEFTATNMKLEVRHES